jgi:hypothetical protein
VHREERFEQTAVAALGEVLERGVGALTNDAPDVEQQIGKGTATALRPGAPGDRSLFDQPVPPGIATWWPLVDGRQDEAERLRPSEEHVREREHVRRPVEQLVGDRQSGSALPRRCQRRDGHQARNVCTSAANWRAYWKRKPWPASG